MYTSIDQRTIAPRSSFSVMAYRGGAEIVDQLADEWRALCMKALDDQPFYRPEWIRAYLRAFVPGAKMLLITTRYEGRLRLLLPLLEERTTLSGVPVRKLRAPVNAHPGRFDFVCCSGADGDAAIETTWKYLANLDGWDLLEFRDTLQGSSAGRLAAAARAEGFRTIQVPEFPNPYVPVPTDPECWKQMPLNAKLRSQLRQARRLLAESGGFKFYRVDAADRDALERFYQLEASGWKGQQGSAIASRSETRQFYDEIADSAARHGYFSLYMLEATGRLIAAHFGLTYRDRYYSPKVAYDEKFKRFAPGHLIVAEILKDCSARGIRCFDITGPSDDWKLKWTSEVHTVNHHYVFKGALGNLACVVRFQLRPAIGRHLLRGSKSA